MAPGGLWGGSRGSLVALIVPLAITVAALFVIPFGGDARQSPKLNAAVERVCTIPSLRVTVQNGDGMHHGVELLTFFNVSGNACTLSGYPRVEAILDSAKGPSREVGVYAPAPIGTRKVATDSQWAWAGGVDVDDTPLKTFVAPTINLAAHTGVARSTLNWVDGPNGSGTCPAFNRVIVRIGADSVTRFVNADELLCYEFAVTPIVEGKTGSMFVATDYSRKANDLVDARAEATGVRAEVNALYHEMTHPSRFSFVQRMQAAASLQESSQYLIRHSPWPALTSSLESVRREVGTLGIDAVRSLMRPGYSHEVDKDYRSLLASLKSLDEVLTNLS